MNLCWSCDQDFSSVKIFDRHRVGVHEYTVEEGLRMSPPKEDGRRCLSTLEMRENGWELNGEDRWSDPDAAAATRKAFSAVHSRDLSASEV